MSLAKSLTATAAAAALVGAIGFAYAQTADGTAAPAGPNVNDQSALQQTPAQPTTPSTGSSMNNSAMPSGSADSSTNGSMNNSSTPAASNDSTAYTERAAQADRN